MKAETPKPVGKMLKRATTSVRPSIHEPRFAKPVFVYWLMTASYHLFGVNEFAAQFPLPCSVLASILLNICSARCRDRSSACSGAATLLLNLQIIGLNRMALTIGVLIFFTTSCRYTVLARSARRGARTPLHLALFYIGMALTTLTKGRLVLIPLLAVGLYLWLTRSRPLFLSSRASHSRSHPVRRPGAPGIS